MRVSVFSPLPTPCPVGSLSPPTSPCLLLHRCSLLPFPVQLSISSRLSLTVLTRSCVSWEDLLFTSRSFSSVTAVMIGTTHSHRGLILAGFFSLSSLSIPSV